MELSNDNRLEFECQITTIQMALQAVLFIIPMKFYATNLFCWNDKNWHRFFSSWYIIKKLPVITSNYVITESDGNAKKKNNICRIVNVNLAVYFVYTQTKEQCFTPLLSEFERAFIYY